MLLRSLLATASPRDQECLYNAALCFRKLSPNVSTHDAVVGDTLERLAAYLTHLAPNLQVPRAPGATLGARWASGSGRALGEAMEAAHAAGVGGSDLHDAAHVIQRRLRGRVHAVGRRGQSFHFL